MKSWGLYSLQRKPFQPQFCDPGSRILYQFLIFAIIILLAIIQSGCTGVTSAKGSSATSTTDTTTAVSVSPAALNFGNVLVGSTSNQSLTVTNLGTTAITISQASASGLGSSISGGPLPVTLNSGQNVTFTVTFAPSATGDVTGSLSFATSDARTFGVGWHGAGKAVGPSISVQPANQSIVVGQTATFSVTASGTPPLTYQWNKNGAAISGATSSTYTTPAETTSDDGAQFNVLVGDSAGSVTSNMAMLSVGSAPVAPSIATQPANQTIFAGQSGTFSVVANGTVPLSYQWRKNGTAISGAVSSSYTTPSETTSDNGALFSVVVSNSAGNLISNNATLTVNPDPVAPSVTSQPASQTITAGQTATFSVTATGTAPLSYQWQKNGAAISGATSSSYATPSETTSDNGAQFAVIVSNSAGNISSNIATLTVNPAPVAPSITTQPSSRTITAGQTATFAVVASGTAPLSYQWQKNGGAISGATASTYTTPATTSSDNGTQFTVTVTNSVGSVTSNAATLTVNAAPVGPSITTQPSSQTITAGQTASFSVTATGTAPMNYQWQKNGSAISGATSAGYTTPAETASDNGAQFAVVVSNTAGSITSSAATLTVNMPPSITTQPSSQTITAGQTASFSVAATGTAPLSYQWRQNGTAISGASSSSYSTPTETTSDNGAQFSVVVSNTAGSVTSIAATLTVNPAAVAPSITTQPLSQTVIAGQAATFSVAATGTAPLNYQWSKNGAAISGATSSSYTTAAETTSDSGSQLTVVVSNPAGSVTSAAATLTVNAATYLLGVSPSSLSFGNVNVGSTSSLGATLANSGNSNVTVSNVTISGAGFSASGISAGQILAPGLSATLNVIFAPPATGGVMGSVTVTSNATNSPTSVSLGGTGMTPSGGTPTCGKSGDGSNHVPTDWTTFVPPARGQSYVDSTFGCTVTRITDSSIEDSTGSVYLALNEGYATVSPINSNDTYLMLEDSQGAHFVTDLTGTVVVPKASMPATGSWLLWDASNASVFYYTNGNSLMKGTISGSSVTSSLVHQFSEYAAINFMDETDVSQDGAHVEIVGGDTSGSSPENVFVYNFVANSKGPVYTTTCTGSVGVPNNSCLHKLIQTADNNVIIQFAGDGSGVEQGNRLWNGTIPLPHIEDGTNHLDAGYDLNGNSVFVALGASYVLSGETNPCPSGDGLDVRLVSNPLLAVCLLDGSQINTSVYWDVGYRGSSSQPWVGLSFFDPNRNPGPEWFDISGSFAAPTASNWEAYEDEIMVARIDAGGSTSKVYRLARAYSRSNEDFFAQPHAAISRDGKYITFNSNMAYAHTGCPANFVSATGCTDVYLIKIQ